MARSVRWFVVAGVLLLAGAVIALVPVPGTFDSESFHCGTAIRYDNSEGYAGSQGFADCDENRRALRFPAGGLMLVGLGIGTFQMGSASRRSRAQRAASSQPVS